MAHRPRPLLVVLVLAAACGFGGSLAAQGTGASNDVLGALLVEVRGLRAAMEQMAAAGPRIQLALGRLQLQEQRVNNALRRHTEVRERLTALESDAAMVSRDIERMQELGENAGHGEERKQMLMQLAHFKERQAQLGLDLQRLRAEELEAAQLLAAEQTRWTDFNQRVEELESALIRR